MEARALMYGHSRGACLSRAAPGSHSGTPSVTVAQLDSEAHLATPIEVRQPERSSAVVTVVTTPLRTS